MPKAISIGMYNCCRCGEDLPYSQYFKSYSEHHAALGGHLPICKDCFDAEYKLYLDRYRDDSRKALKRMCMVYDVYFSEALYSKCEKDDAFIGKYFRQLNMQQHSGKTFENSINEGVSFQSDVVPPPPKSEKIVKPKPPEKTKEKEEPPVVEFDPQDIEKWGYGFAQTEYDELNAHYKYLKTANPNCDSNQEIFINDLCFINMQKMKAVREGRVEDYNKLTESYRKSFSQAGLKTVRDASELESFTVGVNIETIEKYTPAEFYKNKELYKDHDSIGDYMERLVLRPLRNLMHGTIDRDHEYYIKEEEEVNEYSEEE